MKTKILALFISASFLSANAANFYRTGNSDTDWSNLVNWAADPDNMTPVSNIPGGSDTLYFYDLSDNTKTIFDGSQGNRSLTAIYTNNGDIEFSGITLNISNRIEFGKAESTVNNITVGNGSNVTTWMYYGTKSSGVETNLIITGNSTFTATSSTWNHVQLVNSANSKSTVRIDKGSSFITGANFSVNGTHNSAANSDVKVDVKGTLKAAGLYLTDGNNSKAVVNIYGSADVELTAAVAFQKAGATLNFIMQDVSSSRISHVTNGTIDDSSLTAIFRTTSFSAANKNIGIDLQGFYVDGGSFISGENYAILLISASESIFDASIINILNDDQMGGFWKLNGDDQSEWLTWDGNNLYLNLTYIPEPGTYAALLGALAMFLVMSRRRK